MFLLQVLSGKMAGKTFQVSGRTATVGRAKSNDIQLSDPAMSRIHLKISARDNGWALLDLWSRNGTLINGKALEHGEERFVEQGDQITIGMTSFSIALPEDLNEQETIHVDMDRMSPPLGSLKTFYQDRPGTYIKNLELIQGLSELLMGSLELRDIFRRFTDYVLDVFKRIERVAILKKDPETERLVEVIVRTRPGIPVDGHGYSRSIAEEVFQSGEPRLALEFDKQEKSDLSDSQQAIRSYMCVPLISSSEVQGIIYVDSLEHSHGFRQEDLFLLSVLSSSAAMAMENAILVANLEKKVDAKTRALQEVGSQLHQSEIRYKAVFNNMKSGIMVLRKTEDGEDFQILELNEAALRIEGVDQKGKLLGSQLSKALPFAGPCGLMKVLRRVRRSGKSESVIFTIPKDTGIQGYRDCYLYRLGTGEVVVLYEDITEKVMREKEQKELQIQLYNSQKMESMALIAGGVAHNFRNILQAVYGNSEYLEMIYKDHPEIKKIAESIAESVEKGTDLINELLHFSKLSHEADFKDYVDLGDVIEKTCNIISRLMDQKITIETSLEPDVIVKGGFSLLSQVFMNLLINARDAIDGEGRILVETLLKGDKVVCRVSDTGTGMDQETLNRLFDPFFTRKEVGEGTGLGLSTSRGIIGQHRGEITVTSSMGEGSTFEITLPLANGNENEIACEDRISLSELGNNEKILIVDDDEEVLRSMSLLVERLGYRSIKVNKAAEALKHYPIWSPDLVLIDRNMPGMDGLSCVQEMIRLDPNARVMIISGYHDVGPDGIDDDMRQAIRGYLVKPFNIEELARAISQALAA